MDLYRLAVLACLAAPVRAYASLVGDLCQGDAAASERERSRLRELLGRLSAPGGPSSRGHADELGSREWSAVPRCGCSTTKLGRKAGGRSVTVGGAQLAWDGPRRLASVVFSCKQTASP